MPPRIDIDRTEILRLVRAFYARVRQDETLGPIFAAHVEDWPAHEEKITRFGPVRFCLRGLITETRCAST